MPVVMVMSHRAGTGQVLTLPLLLLSRAMLVRWWSTLEVVVTACGWAVVVLCEQGLRYWY